MSRKINLSYISDPKKRKVTLSKRKKGIFKKIIELSVLCNLDVFVMVFDKERQSISQLTSDPDFDHRVVSHMLMDVNREQFKHRQYTNDNYKEFINEKECDPDDMHSFDDDTIMSFSKKSQLKSYHK